MSTSVRFLLPAQIHQQMLDHARSAFPNECCGVLLGKFPSPMLKPDAQAKDALKPDAQAKEKICQIVRDFPVANTLASPTEYAIDQKELFRASKAARADGLDIVGFYHSHPSSAPIPSQKDRERNYWGKEVIHFIISLETDPPELAGWHLTEEKHWQAEWELVGDE